MRQQSIYYITINTYISKRNYYDKNNYRSQRKASSTDGIYGLPFKEKEAKVIYHAIPWDVTTSYQAGTSKGPKAILHASEQIDFFDLDFIDAYQAGLFMKKNLIK